MTTERDFRYIVDDVYAVDSLKVKENTRLLAPKRIQAAISGVMRYGYYK